MGGGYLLQQGLYSPVQHGGPGVMGDLGRWKERERRRVVWESVGRAEEERRVEKTDEWRSEGRESKGELVGGEVDMGESTVLRALVGVGVLSRSSLQ